MYEASEYTPDSGARERALQLLADVKKREEGSKVVRLDKRTAHLGKPLQRCGSAVDGHKQGNGAYGHQDNADLPCVNTNGRG